MEKINTSAHSDISQTMFLLCGLPGSGKTTYTERSPLLSSLDKLSIDEAMYERYGVYDVDYPHTLYKTLEAEVYKELDDILIEKLALGKSVVLDYGFWKRLQRDTYKKIALDHAIDCSLIYFEASRATLSARLLERNRKTGANALKVDAVLFERMHQHFEVPKDEGQITITAPEDTISELTR